MQKPQKTVFVIQPFTEESRPVFDAISTAAAAAGATTVRLDQLSASTSIVEALYRSIESADVIVCDISHANSNAFYELGYAHGLRKPVLIITSDPARIPFDISSIRILFYDLKRGRNEFRKQLTDSILNALEHPDTFSRLPKPDPEITSVFVSYSHQDKQFLDRLLVHLRPLHKEGRIELWSDNRLKAGDRWRDEIELALRRAKVAILLVSADFLASEFIVDNELPPLLASAQERGTRILPVIVTPCRFTRDANLKEFHAINDPKTPLITVERGEQEQVYDHIAQVIESLLPTTNA